VPEKNPSAANSPAHGSLESHQKPTLAAESQPKESVPNPLAAQSTLPTQGKGDIPNDSAQAPVNEARGHELVPKCPKCRAFHARKFIGKTYGKQDFPQPLVCSRNTLSRERNSIKGKTYFAVSLVGRILTSCDDCIGMATGTRTTLVDFVGFI